MNKPCLYLISDGGTSQEVDLAEASDIALTFCVNDIFKLSQPSNGFTKGVKLLGTAKTNKTLGSIYRVDKLDRTILRRRRKARLELNGRDLLGQVGTLEIKNIIYEPTTDTVTYECDLTGEGYNWSLELENLKFCDTELALGSHTADATTIRNSWDRTGVLGTPYPYDYIGCSYFPVHYGWWWHKDYVSIYDLRPHVYVRYLLEKAFGHLGYSLVGDYANSDEFSSLCILFTKGVFGPLATDVDKLYKTFDVIPNTYYDGIVGPQIPTYLEAAPALDGYWYVSTWTQPFTYNMRVVASFLAPQDQFDLLSGVCNFSIYVDDTQVATICFPILALTSPFDVRWEGCILKGQKVRVKIDPDTCGPIAFTFMGILEGAQILLSPISHECYLGDTINLCDTIDPALNFKKILLGIVHAQGLLVFTDEVRKEIELVRIADHYTLLTPQDDYTQRVDCTEKLQQDILTDCINFKLAYLPDNSDNALSIDCTEFTEEMFSLNIINDPSDTCKTEFRNPTFAPTNSVGWQYNREKGFSANLMAQYGAGYATYLSANASNTNNWSGDTWTQPYTCEMMVVMYLDAGLVNLYHRWAIEIDGVPVASEAYNQAGIYLLRWFGCVAAGSEVKFAISADINIAPVDYIEIAANDAQVSFYYKYFEYHDIAGSAAFKPIVPSIRLIQPDLSNTDLEPMDIIKYGGEPRIVYYAGLMSDTDLGWTGAFGWDYDDSSGVAAEALFPYAYFFDYYQLTARKSLAFNSITRNTSSPDLAGGTVPETSVGAARLNYGILLDSLATGVMLKLWVRFTEQEIRNLRFGVPKYFGGISIGQGMFYLNRVRDWNPDKQLALCEFIQVSHGETF